MCPICSSGYVLSSWSLFMCSAVGTVRANCPFHTKLISLAASLWWKIGSNMVFPGCFNVAFTGGWDRLQIFGSHGLDVYIFGFLNALQNILYMHPYYFNHAIDRHIRPFLKTTVVTLQACGGFERTPILAGVQTCVPLERFYPNKNKIKKHPGRKGKRERGRKKGLRKCFHPALLCVK